MMTTGTFSNSFDSFTRIFQRLDLIERLEKEQEVARWVKGLAANLDSLLILRTTWRKQRADSHTLSSDLHRCAMTHTYTQAINT